MMPNFLILTARASSFSKLISPSFLSSSFLAAIFSKTSFCLFRMASILEKSCSSCPSANICSYNCPGRKSYPKPPLLQLRLGSRRDRLRKMSSEVTVFRQKMQVLFQTFLARQLLTTTSCSTRCHWPCPFQKRLANLWRGILSISTSVSGGDQVQGFDLMSLGFWALGLVCLAVCCASNLCPSSSGKRKAQYFLESRAIARISFDQRKRRMPSSFSFFKTYRRGSRFFIKIDKRIIDLIILLSFTPGISDQIQLFFPNPILPVLQYMQTQPIPRREQQPPSRRFINLSSKAVKQQKFDFKTQQLAFSVRQVVYQKIIAFDANGDQHFQEAQIREFLVHVLHEVETEIHYFIKNVFRYDYNNDGLIEYDELVNFCMEQHLGEIAIQRLHRKKVYSRGASRQMNGQQFTKTITYALSFIEFKPNPAHLESLFRSVDLDGDNFISYEDYFRFLKEYFGSKSLAARLVSASSVREEMQHPEKKELDILRKYLKYEKGGEGGSGGQGQGHGAGKHVPTNVIKNSIMNGGNSNNNAGYQGGSNINNPNINSNNPNTNNPNGNNPNTNNPNGNNPNSNHPNAINNLPNDPNANPFGNSNLNSGTNAGNNNQGGIWGSGVFNIDAKTIDNSSISRDLDLNSQSTDKKRNPSNPQGRIQVTIGKPPIKTPREARQAESALLSEQQGIIGARISRLVMTQLKTNLINYDSAKTLRLSSEEILKFLRVVLNFNEANILTVVKKGNLTKEKKWTYEEASRVVISESTARIFAQLAIPDLTKPVSVQQFVKIWDRVCSIVVNTPLIDKFEQLYKLRVARTGQLDSNELYQLINAVFMGFAFRQ